jgi:hypothetical protein
LTVCQSMPHSFIMPAVEKHRRLSLFLSSLVRERKRKREREMERERERERSRKVVSRGVRLAACGWQPLSWTQSTRLEASACNATSSN